MAELKFNPTLKNVPVKPSLTKFTDSRLRANILTSEGKFSDRPFPPYFALPVMWKDTTTEDWVVLNKGTIVSALTNMSVDPSTNTTAGTKHIGDPDLSGIVYLGLDAAGTMRNAYVDSTYWGYAEYIAGLVVPCNGGTASRLPYSTDDVSQTITVSGAFVTSANVAAAYTLPLAINRPIGVVYQDLYQDQEGRYLNYEIENRSKYGVVYDHVIEIPYVDVDALTGATPPIESISASLASMVFTQNCVLTANSSDLYTYIWKKYPFLYGANKAALQPGIFLVSDLYGKFIPFTEAGSIDQQVVGRLIVTDTRFPKGNLEFVDSYEGSKTPGTDTGGLPYLLYIFVYDLLVGAGITASTHNILQVVHGGAVGMATINLQIA